MPRRYGGSPQPRGYGGYDREGSYAYQAEATPPAWLAGLDEAVGGFMDQRAQRKAEEQARSDKFEAMNQDVKGRMMLANADIESSFVKQETQQREERLAAEKQTVIADLATRFSGGDLSAGAKLAAMGLPAATINALKPEEKKIDPQNPTDRAYATRMGSLKADREMGVGAFAPSKPTPPPKPVSPIEVRRRATDGVRAMVGVVLDMNPNASRSAVLNAVVNDPSNKDLAGNELFQNSLRAVIDREMFDERRRRAPSGGGKASTLGARATALNAKK